MRKKIKEKLIDKLLERNLFALFYETSFKRKTFAYIYIYIYIYIYC